MPRRRKIRNCRRLDGDKNFKPSGIPRTELESVILELDEFETLRLCDYDGLSQIEAGEVLGVSRGTVQRLLSTGRKKIVDVLLHSKELILKDENNNHFKVNGYYGKYIILRSERLGMHPTGKYLI